MMPATKAAVQARQKAVDQEQLLSRLKPMPMKKPTMAQKIIKDFIRTQLISNMVASKGYVLLKVQNSVFIGGFLRK